MAVSDGAELIGHTFLIGPHDSLRLLPHSVLRPQDISPEGFQQSGGIVGYLPVPDLIPQLLPQFLQRLQVLLVIGQGNSLGFSPLQIIFQPLYRHIGPGHLLQFLRRQAHPLLRYSQDLLYPLQGDQRRRTALFQHLPALCGLPQPPGQFRLGQNHARVLYFLPGRFRQGAFPPLCLYFVKFQTDFRLYHFRFSFRLSKKSRTGTVVMAHSVSPDKCRNCAENAHHPHAVERQTRAHLSQQSLHRQGGHNPVRQDSVKNHLVNAVKRYSGQIHT